MSLHCFASIVTQHGTAANNRGETEGNTTTLQKLLWHGQTHTTVSAEAIRYAIRRQLAASEPCNRGYDEDTRQNTWQDPKFTGWRDKKGVRYIDDDLMGFMLAEAAAKEATKAGKGKTTARRAVLEVSRAVSLTPWSGDLTFNAASPGATPSAAKKGLQNPVPYATEMHATRYQFGVALTPERLDKPERAATAIRSIASLSDVAGNQARFLFDFSPSTVVFRVTHDPAPRILYCYEPDGRRVAVPTLVSRVKAGDILPEELIIGGELVGYLSDEARAALAGAQLVDGVVAAAEAACERIAAS